MPGLLKPRAKCPKCGDRLIASFRTLELRPARTIYEYVHDKPAPPRQRRRRPCKVIVPAANVRRYEATVYNPLHVR